MNRNFFLMLLKYGIIYVLRFGINPVFILMADIRRKTNKRQKGEVILQNERFQSKEQM